MNHQYDDGGRSAAGYRGQAGDCVCRAISIAAQLPYQEVYTRLALGNAMQRNRNRKPRRTAREGIRVQSKWFKDYMLSLGFHWTATMRIGSGCHVHLRKEELPHGRLVVHLSKHSAAVIDGVLHDTYDCSRKGTRCVYGYWQLS